MQSVKLIGVTQPTITIFDDMKLSAEGLIAYCARVSNPANQDNPDSEKLLKYCVRNEHWSIFEMVNIVMEISTTRDIARQILRHRSFSFQEFSQRYAQVTDMSPPREARLQDPKNRQNSIKHTDEHLMTTWNDMQEALIEYAQETYEWAIKNGVAKEQARVVLPEGLTMSRMYMNGTLRSWIHWIQLRTKSSTQMEHREIAEQAKQIILEQFPSLKEVI